MKADLPIEIYLNIFQRLLRHDQKECLYVCKNWNHTIAQSYYEEIVVDHRQIDPFSKFLKLQPNNISRCTRKLTFTVCRSRGNRIIATKECFHLMLSYLPYLKTICFDDPENDAWFLENLSDVDLNYVVNLQKVTINSVLELYPFGSRNPDVLQLYHADLARFKGSITHLYFKNLQSDVCADNDLLSYLSQFTRLTHLKINKISSFDRQLPALPLILKVCSRNLRDFDLHEERVDEQTVTHFLGNADYFPPHVTHFQLRLTHLFSSYTKYIVQNIPPHQLTNLSIDVTKEFLSDWVNNSPSTIVDRFTTYLGTIRNLKFSIGKDAFSRGATAVATEAIPHSFSAMLDITNKIINKRPLFYRIELSLVESYQKPHPTIQVENNQRIDLRVMLQDPDLHLAGDNMNLMDYISDDNTTPHAKWMVNAFYLCKWSRSPVNPADILLIFPYMIEKCRRLHHFLITNHDETFAAGPSPGGNPKQDLRNIDYIGQMVTATRFKSATQIAPTKKNLKYLSFENTRVSDNLLNLLIQQGLEVETMRFSLCVFRKDVNNNSSLTLMESVSTLIFDLEAEHHTYIFLEIEMHDKCVYYQSHKKTVQEFKRTSSPNYEYNRYKSKNTTVLRVKGDGLKQIIVNAHYAKNMNIQSLLHPQNDI